METYLIRDVVAKTVESEDAEKLGGDVFAPARVSLMIGFEQQAGWDKSIRVRKRERAAFRTHQAVLLRFLVA